MGLYTEPIPPGDLYSSATVKYKTKPILLTVAAACFGVWLLSFGIYALTKRSAPQSGEIGVVRNGSAPLWVFDWFDNHKIRGVIPNGAGSTALGLGSSVHYYPVEEQQRFFRLQTCEDKDHQATPCEGADDVAITIPTSDGVSVGVEGTFYLNTGFNNTNTGLNLLKKFDTQFGTRTWGEDHLYAWDGTGGWKAFLASNVEPVIANNLRQTIAGVSCAELVSSCALVQNSNLTQTVSLSQSKANLNNVNAVQEKVNAGLQTDLNNTLQDPYFKNVRFKLTHVDLPGEVQRAIDKAQASFAQVTQAQAQVKSASLEAQANEKKQHGYEHCPACAQIDELKAIPSTLQTYAPGGPFAVTGR